MRARYRHRRGTIYLIVMSTVAIVTALSLTGVALSRVERRVSERAIDILDARDAAQSTMELAAQLIATSTTWRADADAQSGLLGKYGVGRARVTVTLTDPVDGDLKNADLDPVIVECDAVIGNVRQKYSQKLTLSGAPMSCIDVGVAALKAITINSGVVLGSSPMATNTSVSASASRVWSPTEAGVGISGTTYYSTTKSLQPARQFPASTVISTYVAMATAIPTSSLTSRTLSGVGLTATSNPHGVANSRAMYYIDCANNPITITNCRIVGTLILLNCPATTTITGSVSFEQSTPGMPVLLVDGQITIKTSSALLAATAVGDPSGTSYPSRFGGLVYISNSASIAGEVQVAGSLVVGGGLDISGTLQVLFDDTYSISPPVGFRGSQYVQYVPGTLTQVVSP